jgi:hypothetical protein
MHTRTRLPAEVKVFRQIFKLGLVFLLFIQQRGKQMNLVYVTCVAAQLVYFIGFLIKALFFSSFVSASLGLSDYLNAGVVIIRVQTSHSNSLLLSIIRGLEAYFNTEGLTLDLGRLGHFPSPESDSAGSLVS